MSELSLRIEDKPHFITEIDGKTYSESIFGVYIYKFVIRTTSYGVDNFFDGETRNGYKMTQIVEKAETFDTWDQAQAMMKKHFMIYYAPVMIVMVKGEQSIPAPQLSTTSVSLDKSPAR